MRSGQLWAKVPAYASTGLRAVVPAGVAARIETPSCGIGCGLAALGLGAWVGFSALESTTGLDGFRLGEAWNATSYYLVGLPLMAAGVAAASYAMPRAPLRWALALVAGHQVGVFFTALEVQSAPSRLLLTLMTSVLLGTMFAVPALAAGMLARRGATTGSAVS